MEKVTAMAKKNVKLIISFWYLTHREKKMQIAYVVALLLMHRYIKLLNCYTRVLLCL